MPKRLTNLLLASCLLSLPVFFGACLKDSCDGTKMYRIYTPVYKPMAEARAEIRNSAPTEVEIPGKFYIWGNYIFLNDVDRGIHVYDNSNPSAPKNIAWIPIPGNMDMTVRGNIMYADFFTDLLMLDISNPADIRVAGSKPGFFPQRSYGNGIIANGVNIVTDWQVRDTIVKYDCSNDGPIFYSYDGVYLASYSASSNGAQNAVTSPHGVGGSMARFTIAKNWLYTVSSSDLKAVDLANPLDPVVAKSVQLNWGVETIFPFRDQLFLGSQTGMYRFNIDNPADPKQVGLFAHVRSCDPVVANDKNAFVTLRSGTECAGYTNQLDVLNIDVPNDNDLMPLLRSYSMKNPHGLGLDGNLLFICDGSAGLKVLDASNVLDIKPLITVPMDAYDVILYNNRALVIAKDGLYQFSYSTGADLTQLSHIPITITEQ